MKPPLEVGQPMSTSGVVVCDDIGYVIHFEARDYHVNFVIYTLAGIEWVTNKILYEPNFCESTDLADVFLHGSVKWDGCSNWHFDEQDRVMIHGCSRDDLEGIGLLLTKCFDIAHEIMGDDVL